MDYKKLNITKYRLSGTPTWRPTGEGSFIEDKRFEGIEFAELDTVNKVITLEDDKFTYETIDFQDTYVRVAFYVPEENFKGWLHSVLLFYSI